MTALEKHVQEQKAAAAAELAKVQGLIDRAGIGSDVSPTLVATRWKVHYTQASGSTLTAEEFEALLASYGINEPDVE